MSLDTSFSLSRKRPPHQVVTQAWRRFHFWTASAAGVLLFVNAHFLTQPLPLAKTRASDRIDSTLREPASASIPKTAIETSGLGLIEIQVGCKPQLSFDVDNSVRQIRLLLSPCPAAIRSIRNETNGFEATLFGTASTDYLSLATGENQIVIDRTELTQRLKIVKAAAPVL